MFDTNVTYPDIGGIPGNNFTDPRGWVSIDVTLEPKGKTFRFLNTHLESFIAPVRTIQAQELVDGPLRKFTLVDRSVSCLRGAFVLWLLLLLRIAFAG